MMDFVHSPLCLLFTLQGSDVGGPEFGFFAGGLIATDHVQMTFKHPEAVFCCF